jgi:hypothetical protein
VVDSTAHAPWSTDPDRVTTELEEFLTGSHAAPAQSHRALRTVLFTDMVASTQHAAATGDERWRAVLHRLDEITADLTQRFGGTVVNSTGDGHLITFRRLFWSHSSPARGSTITVAATYSVVRPVMLLASRVECSVRSLLTQGYRHPWRRCRPRFRWSGMAQSRWLPHWYLMVIGSGPSVRALASARR